MIKERCLFGYPCAVEPAKELGQAKEGATTE
jgi:hypothetical protein